MFLVFFSPVSHWDFVLCRYAVAESDCNLAIALDSNYFKAYARRGAARFALKKYECALEGEKLFKGFDHLSSVRALRWQYESLSEQIMRWFSSSIPATWKHRMKLRNSKRWVWSDHWVVSPISPVILPFIPLFLWLVSEPRTWSPGHPEWRNQAATGGSHSGPWAAETDGGAAETTGGSCTERQSKLCCGSPILCCNVLDGLIWGFLSSFLGVMTS